MSLWVDWQIWKVHFLKMGLKISHSLTPPIKSVQVEYLRLASHYLPTFTIDIRRLLDVATANSDNLRPGIVIVNVYAQRRMLKIFQPTSQESCSSGHNRDLNRCCYSHKHQQFSVSPSNCHAKAALMVWHGKWFPSWLNQDFFSKKDFFFQFVQPTRVIFIFGGLAFRKVINQPNTFLLSKSHYISWRLGSLFLIYKRRISVRLCKDWLLYYFWRLMI